MGQLFIFLAGWFSAQAAFAAVIGDLRLVVMSLVLVIGDLWLALRLL